MTNFSDFFFYPVVFSMKLLLILTVCMLMAGPAVLACNIPVFRYALEHWSAENYRISIIYEGMLEEREQGIVDWLKKYSASGDNHYNFTVNPVNILDMDRKSRDSFAIPEDKSKLPLVNVQYPESSGIMKTAWEGELSLENMRALIDSPARQEIAEQLLNSDTIVWAFIESGNTETDKKIQVRLNNEFRKIEKELNRNLYSGDPIPPAKEQDTGRSDIDIRFSLISISRSDQEEKIFVSLLMNTEPDLEQFSSMPLVFPFYGRGRVLYSLVGKGITSENIHEAVQFLTGPCSCVIKNASPGIDMLLTVNWESALDNSFIPLEKAPDFNRELSDNAVPLTGLGELLDFSRESEDTSETENYSIASQPLEQKEGKPSFTKQNVVITLIIVIVLGMNVLLTIAIWKKVR